MKVFLINDSSSNPNWGDRAAAMSLKQMIFDAGATIDSIVTEDDLRATTFFQAAPLATQIDEERRTAADWVRLLVPPIVPKLFRKISAQLGSTGESDAEKAIPDSADNVEDCACRLMEGCEGFDELVRRIDRCDVVVIHGDGGMFGFGVIPRTKLFLAYFAKKHLGKPVALINHTADFDHPALDRMAATVYPMLDDVTYRDQESATRCEGRWPGRYVPDTAFLFEPADKASWGKLASRPGYCSVWPDQADFDPGKPYVCVGGSSILSYDERSNPTELIQHFTAMVRHLCEQYDGQVVLTISDVIDEPVLRPVARALELPVIGLRTPVQQAVDVVGNADAYIGGRWHVAIFALRGGTPVVPLSSKTFKIPALMSMAGLNSPVFDAASVENHQAAVVSRLAEVIAEGKPLRHRLREWARQQADACRDNIRILESGAQ